MVKVMFVCTGNICRSAMAHAYLKYLVDLNGLENEIIIDSCGTNAVKGEESTDYAKMVINEYGASLVNHRATHIREFDLNDYQYIIAMTHRHKEDILRLYPNVGEKVFLLKEFNPSKYMDIDDPWGWGLNIYKSCAKDIVDCVNNLFYELKK